MSDSESQNPPIRHAASNVPFVVGIGASAGGLKALEQFFESMPHDSGAAFVVIQHLSPDFKSLMNELLGRRTQMAIYKIEDGMVLEPDSIYLIPPRKNLVVEHQSLRLIDQQRNDGHQLNFPIDIFFQSLAKTYAESSIGIVLSGTGSDGTRGLQEIHQAGGISLVQDLATAEFDGMPQSAIATGGVDQVAPPGELAQIIYQFIQSPIDAQQFRAETNLFRSGSLQLQRITNILAEQEEIDFSHYKSSTLSRRIQRRCLIAGYNDLDTYIQHLTTSADERAILRNDLLINVTRFFRDGPAWDYLESEVIPKLVANTKAGTQLRVWITACATGEEAYSMAMLIHEAIERSGQAVEAKIFATDIHSTALEKAAQGIYPRSIVNDISEERLHRYFTSKNESFEVSRQLREMLIFAPHNLAKDAGFTRMSLVSCRNVLIYMQHDLQQQVLRNLHFSLMAQGILFLGESETLAELQEEFTPLEKRWKVFEKLRDVRLPMNIRGASQLSRPISRNPTRELSQSRLDPMMSEALKSVLAEHNTTCLLVDSNNQLLHVCGDVLKLLQVPEGPITQDVTKMMPAPLQLPLNTALHRAQRHQQPVEYTGLQIKASNNTQSINLKVTFHKTNKLGKAFLLVEISEVGYRLPPQIAAEQFEANTEAAQRIMQLEHELQQTRENLQATIEELESTNEEQQATNEELVASNEELQSTNEELHAVNEELYTVNAEYQNKIQELTQLNNDIDNLLQSTNIGVVFLDSNLNIRKFTAAATQALNLVDADIGRPLAHLSHNLDCPDLLGTLNSVMEEEQDIEQEVILLHMGLHQLMRVHPYRVGNQRSQGVVLTFVNIDKIKKAQAQLQREIDDRQKAEAALQALNITLEQRVEQRTAELQAIFRAIPDAIMFAGLDRRIQMVNPAFDRLFGYSQADIIGKRTRKLYANAEEYEAQGLKRFNTSTSERLKPYEVNYRHQDGTVIPGESVGTSVKDEQGNTLGFVGVIRDIRERKQAEQKLFQQLIAMETSIDGIAILHNNRYTYINPAHVQLFGYHHPQDLLGKTWDELYEPEQMEWFERAVFPQLQQQGHWRGETKAKRQDGFLFDEEISLTLTSDGGLVCVRRDITQRKQAEQKLQQTVNELTRSNKDLEQFAYVASHDLREPLRKVKSFSKLLVQSYQEQVDPQALRYIDFMTDGIDRMEKLINDLLTYSRIGKDHKKSSMINLGTELKTVLSDLSILIDEHQVTVTQSDLPSVAAKSIEIQQLFLNLISNAIKFRSDSPLVIHVAAERQQNEWVISIEDNGIGIPEKFAERIFVIFQQLHPRSKYPGTGIGLALCRKIVEILGGRIWVESEVGQGSTFYFTLPCVDGDSS